MEFNESSPERSTSISSQMPRQVEPNDPSSPKIPVPAISTSKSSQLRPTTKTYTTALHTARAPESTPELDTDNMSTSHESSPEGPPAPSPPSSEPPELPPALPPPELHQRLHEHGVGTVLRERRRQSRDVWKQAVASMPQPVPKSEPMIGYIYRFADQDPNKVPMVRTVEYDLVKDPKNPHAAPQMRIIRKHVPNPEPAPDPASSLDPALPPAPAPLLSWTFDPCSTEFKMETLAGYEQSDIRYLIPLEHGADAGPVDQVQRALKLTYADFILRSGEPYPSDLVDAYKYESYAAQYHRLQERFEALWKGPGDAPDLYSLEGWTRDWEWWLEDDVRGQDLEAYVAENLC